MRLTLAFSTLVVVQLLSGCNNAEDAYHEDSHVDRTPFINYFTAIPAPGTYAYAYGAVPITPHVNDGNFEMHWEIESYGPTHVDLFVSNDTWLGPEDAWGREDLLVTHLWSAANTYSDEFHINTTYMGCRFTNDNFFSCGTITNDNPGRDITPFLRQLPQTGYVILRACDGLTDICATASLYVEFQ